MVRIDPESSPSDAPPAEIAQSLAAAGETTIRRQSRRLLALALAAGLLAGVASSFAGEVIVNRYENETVPARKLRPSPEDLGRFRDARLYSAALTFTAMGGFLGLTMGWAGGLARHSVFAGARAAILGLLLGTAVVAPLALVLVSNFFKRHNPHTGGLLLPLLTHGAIWSAVGAIGGLAFGLGLGGRGRWKATAVGGLVGAASATVVYELVGALAFALDRTDLPLSTSITTRGMAQLLVAILSAMGVVLALAQSSKQPAASSLPS